MEANTPRGRGKARGRRRGNRGGAQVGTNSAPGSSWRGSRANNTPSTSHETGVARPAGQSGGYTHINGSKLQHGRSNSSTPSSNRNQRRKDARAAGPQSDGSVVQTYGSGPSALVLASDSPFGVWKVGVSTGNRFSRAWLDNIHKWALTLHDAASKSSQPPVQTSLPLDGTTRAESTVEPTPAADAAGSAQLGMALAAGSGTSSGKKLLVSGLDLLVPVAPVEGAGEAATSTPVESVQSADAVAADALSGDAVSGNATPATEFSHALSGMQDSSGEDADSSLPATCGGGLSPELSTPGDNFKGAVIQEPGSPNTPVAGLVTPHDYFGTVEGLGDAEPKEEKEADEQWDEAEEADEQLDEADEADEQLDEAEASISAQPESPERASAHSGHPKRDAEPVSEVAGTGPARKDGGWGRSKTKGPVRVSLRLERMGFTDAEMKILADWSEKVAAEVQVVKLWLFGNNITDVGAVHCARMLHAGMLEVHLSHNFIGDEGGAALLQAVPAPSPPPQRGLWLRVEWNLMSWERLQAEIEQQHKERGLVVDLGEKKRAHEGHDHENTMDFKNKRAHLKCPWIESQKQAASEAAVLKNVKESWRARRLAAESRDATAIPLAPPPPPSAGPSLSSTSSSAATSDPTASIPEGAPPPPAGPCTATSAEATEEIGPSYDPPAEGRGPLLLFPDTSALLSMLGANQSQGRSTFTLDLLARMADRNRFGRCLALEDQTFIVVADSVVKQLDGLKKEGNTAFAVRRFFAEGMQRYGPLGADFVTVLGNHEGEGLVLEHAATVAGSSSTSLQDKGQIADIKIVEVALFFQKEILSAGQHQGDSEPPPVPVILLSNDNTQVQLAKSHGLPALRVDSELQERMAWLLKDREPLTSSHMRTLMTPIASVGVGEAASKSLQREFDGVVATLKVVTGWCRTLCHTLQQVGAASQYEPEAALSAIRCLLYGHLQPLAPHRLPRPTPQPPNQVEAAAQGATEAEGTGTETSSSVGAAEAAVGTSSTLEEKEQEKEEIGAAAAAGEGKAAAVELAAALSAEVVSGTSAATSKQDMDGEGDTVASLGKDEKQLSCDDVDVLRFTVDTEELTGDAADETRRSANKDEGNGDAARALQSESSKGCMGSSMMSGSGDLNASSINGTRQSMGDAADVVVVDMDGGSAAAVAEFSGEAAGDRSQGGSQAAASSPAKKDKKSKKKKGKATEEMKALLVSMTGVALPEYVDPCGWAIEEVRKLGEEKPTAGRLKGKGPKTLAAAIAASDAGPVLPPAAAVMLDAVQLVETALMEWEVMVKSHQSPSRLLKWAAAAPQPRPF